MKPGLRGASDPRLYNTRAQLIGGACVALMLIVNGLGHADARRGSGRLGPMTLAVPVGLMVAALFWLQRDRRLVTPERLNRFDKSARPLCHHCLKSLLGQPANGTCPGCGRAYHGIELAGGVKSEDRA